MKQILKQRVAAFALAATAFIGASPAWCATAADAARPAVKAAVKKQAPVDLAAKIAAATVKDGIRYIPNIRYISEYKQCVGDLYLPASTARGGKVPAILLVHGGAWILGSRGDTGIAYMCEQLAKHGYAAYNIDYRLIQDGGTYPSSVKDVNDALGFMEANADKLDIDSSRIGIFGGSAGALLALLTAYAPHTGPFEPTHFKQSNAKPKAVVTYGAITDLRNLEYPWIFKYIDDTPYHSPQTFAEASPITYAKTAVPTLCEHGAFDNTVPIAQSESLVKALKELEIPAEMVTIPHVRHVFYLEPGPNREMALEHLIAFFDKYVKGDQ